MNFQGQCTPTQVTPHYHESLLYWGWSWPPPLQKFYQRKILGYYFHLHHCFAKCSWFCLIHLTPNLSTFTRLASRETVCICASVVGDWWGQGECGPLQVLVWGSIPHRWRWTILYLVHCIYSWLSRTVMCFATAGGYTM